MSSEFDLIQRFFKRTYDRSDIEINNGDDCAVVAVPDDHRLVVTTDTLVEGVHFPRGTAPQDIAHKSLAVSLSDLAAMGSVPKWFTLSLTMPEYDESWLADFSHGLFTLAGQFHVALIGGDTTRGPLSITIQAMGSVMAEMAVPRSGAQEGDDVYVTGSIGGAALGLKAVSDGFELPDHQQYFCQQDLNRPMPRVAAGVGLGPFATAMIDCSDGLVADLQHLLTASGMGAVIKASRVPYPEAIKDYLAETGDYALPLTGGDDYELIFTASPKNRSVIAALPEAIDCPFTWLGTVTTHEGLIVLDDSNEPMVLNHSGYLHF